LVFKAVCELSMLQVADELKSSNQPFDPRLWPCCYPTRMASLTVVIQVDGYSPVTHMHHCLQIADVTVDGGWRYEIRELKEMKVVECGC
jgi:hypothetical protein